MVILMWMGMNSPANANDIALRLDTSWGHNSNLFRNESTQAPTTGQIQSSTAFLTFGIPLASDSTRLILSSELTLHRYDAAPNLNATDHTHTLRLPWRFTELWSGELNAGASTQAYPVDDFYTNLDRIERHWTGVVLTLKPTPSLEFPLQIHSGSTTYADRISHANLDEKLNSTSVSMVYRTPLGNTAQIGILKRQVDHPNRVNGNATTGQHEDELDAFIETLWQASPRTQINARASSRKRSSTDAASNDSRQTIFRLGVGHAISPFTRIESQFWREPYQSTDTQVNDSISKGYGLGVVYTPSPKTNLRATWQKYSQTDYLNPQSQANTPLNPSTKRFSIRGEYELTRGIVFFADASRENQTRREIYKSHQNVWRVGLEYRYENIPGAALRNTPAAYPSR